MHPTLRPLLLASLAAAPAGAATLRGTVVLPPDPRPAEARPLANWRVENGVLPIVPTSEGREAVVVLEGTRSKDDDAPQTNAHATVEAHGLQVEPRLAVAQVGTTFDFKNLDRVPRTLFLRDAEGFMSPEATAPGATRSVRFAATGAWVVRDADYPHATATLVVVDSPFVARVDERGGFRIEAPEGRYTLKVFYRGAWAASQPVEVGRGGEVTVRVAKPETAHDAAPLAARKK